jgi:hypothetical protein
VEFFALPLYELPGKRPRVVGVSSRLTTMVGCLVSSWSSSSLAHQLRMNNYLVQATRTFTDPATITHVGIAREVRLSHLLIHCASQLVNKGRAERNSAVPSGRRLRPYPKLHTLHLSTTTL